MVLLTFSLLLVLFLSSRALLSGVLFWAMGRGSFFCMLLLGFLLLVPSCIIRGFFVRLFCSFLLLGTAACFCLERGS
jgi:hypothetical protein